MISNLVQRANFICKMGRRGALSQAEKSRELDRDHRTIKKFVTNPELCNGRSDKGKISKKAPVSHREKSAVTLLELAKTFLKMPTFLMCPNQLDAVS